MDNVNTSENNELPVNSDTLLIDESTSRFSSAIRANKITEKTIILAGLGGIGSYVTLLLSRIKPCKMIFYDPDIIEEANMSGQLYGNINIGQPKSTAAYEIATRYSNYFSIYALNQAFVSTSSASDIMICGFDNMAARKTFYNRWKSYITGMPEGLRKKALFIDGRLAAEEFQIFCIRGDDTYHMKDYESKWLFDDSEAEATVCSYKQTSHCASMIASVMVNLLVNHVTNECNPLIERDVPYMTTYDASTMYFKTLS